MAQDFPDAFLSDQESAFTPLRSAWTAANDRGCFDPFTYSIHIPREDLDDSAVSPTFAHELVHFLQMSATELGLLHQNLNMNITKAGAYLSGMLNDHGYALKAPLFSYVEALSKTDRNIGALATLHLNHVTNTVDVMQATFARRSDLDFSKPPADIEIDLDGRSFIVNGAQRFPVSCDLIIESMAYTADRFFENMEGSKSRWKIPFSTGTAQYWLPWIYLYLKGDSGGIPFYLLFAGWLTLFQSVGTKVDEFGYDTCLYEKPSPWVDVFLRLLRDGPVGARLFERELEKSASMMEAFDTVLKSLAIGAPSGASSFAGQVETMRDARLSYARRQNREAGSRNILNTLIASIGAEFLNAVLQNDALLLCPAKFFNDRAIPRPLAFFRDRVSYPTATPAVVAWYYEQHLWAKLIWGSSFECYDMSRGAAFDGKYYYFDCPRAASCKGAPDKRSLNFCENAPYLEFCTGFFRQLRQLSYREILAARASS